MVIACFICQEDLKDKLVFPLNSNSNNKVEHKKQYSNIVNKMRQFENVESISVPLRNLLKIENLEEECVSNMRFILKDVEVNTMTSSIKEQ